jgi:arsenate reductase
MSAPAALRVLFLCTHNSARSQMAEGLLRHLGGGRFDVFSAGTEATTVRPLAIGAMAELGIDISGQQSKTLERYLHQPFDSVITVCDQANEACPVFYGARNRLHWSFPDPSTAAGPEAEQLAVYRQVRDAIRQRIERELLYL